MSNNVDIGQLMKILSKMDKKDLENSMTQLSNMLKTNDKSKIINELKNNMNNR